MLDGYVYRYLKKYGNTVLSNEDYDKFGRDKILEDLKNHGFDCEITIYDNKEPCFNNSSKKEKEIITDVIVSVIRR